MTKFLLSLKEVQTAFISKASTSKDRLVDVQEFCENYSGFEYSISCWLDLQKEKGEFYEPRSGFVGVLE